MAFPPIRAILVVGYNILRTTCRKYGLYLCILAAVLFLHSYSGYRDAPPQTKPQVAKLVETDNTDAGYLLEVSVSYCVSILLI